MTKKRIKLRRAVDADREALGRYGGALMRQHHAFDPERFIQVPHPEVGYARFLAGEVANDESLVMVAERDGQVIGYVYASLEPQSWKELRGACGYLHDVFVDADARGTGTGKRLVRAAIAWLEKRGAPRVVLLSAARNEGAQRLFARLGFRPTMVEMTRERGG